MPFTKLSHVCSLPIVTVSQICSLRGKMIPEELERRVQEAKKEVRGPGEGGRGNMGVSGPEGEDAGSGRPPLLVGEGRGLLRVGGGSSSAELLCLVLALSVLWSFSNVLIPGGLEPVETRMSPCTRFLPRISFRSLFWPLLLLYSSSL